MGISHFQTHTDSQENWMCWRSSGELRGKGHHGSVMKGAINTLVLTNDQIWDLVRVFSGVKNQ